MKCINCNREIPENSVFCNWCGERQIKERKKKDEIKVPIPRQLPSGRWFIQLKAEGKSITEDTQDLCIAKAKAIRAGFLEEKAKAPVITLSAAIDKYIESRSNILSPATIRGYRRIQRGRFKSYINTPISKITDWQSVCNNESTLCSAKTLKNAYSFVHSVMSFNGISIPAITLPQVVKKERPWLEPEQIKVFVKLIQGTDFEIPALLALCSLRRSEIYGLTWDKIDLSGNGTITISGSVVQDDNGVYVNKETNKNESSQRRIPILIPQLKEALISAKNKSGFVCSGRPDYLARKVNRICKLNGLPEIGTHGLRHSFASLAYHLHLSILETMRIGGWSEPGTVQRIYTHLSERDKNDAMIKIQEFYKIDNDLANTI